MSTGTAPSTTPAERGTTAQDVAYLQAGPERFSAGLATGRSCDYQRAKTEAETPVQELLSLRRAPLPGGLTEREVGVQRSVAESNTEIATRLTISPRTVHAPLRSILEKLKVNSRTAAAHEAARLAQPKAFGNSRSGSRSPENLSRLLDQDRC
jgi:DNA-binding NarL/FixJ family response regulator